MSILLSLSKNEGVTSDFTTFYSPPIDLGTDPWEVALVKFHGWYSWYNVSPAYGNNVFRYINDGPQTDIVFPAGAYGVEDLNNFLINAMIANGDFDPLVDTYPPVMILPNYNTLKVEITIRQPGYAVDLSASNLWYILGFSYNQTLTPITVTTSGDLPANITNDINEVQIRTSLLSASQSSYTNAKLDEVIYSFVPSSPPGSNIEVTPAERVYIPLNRHYLVNNVRLYITDQLGRLIDFNGEDVSVLLHMRRHRP